MKKILLLITLFALASCEKDTEPTPLTQAEQEQVNSLLVGTWEDAGYIYDGDKDGIAYPICIFTTDFIFSEMWAFRETGEIGGYRFPELKYTLSKIEDNVYRLNFRVDGADIQRTVKIKGDNLLLSPQSKNGAYYNLSRITP